jgi:hypothetical protein
MGCSASFTTRRSAPSSLLPAAPTAADGGRIASTKLGNVVHICLLLCMLFVGWLHRESKLHRVRRVVSRAEELGKNQEELEEEIREWIAQRGKFFQ